MHVFPLWWLVISYCVVEKTEEMCFFQSPYDKNTNITKYSQAACWY